MISNTVSPQVQFRGVQIDLGDDSLSNPKAWLESPSVLGINVEPSNSSGIHDNEIQIVNYECDSNAEVSVGFDQTNAIQRISEALRNGTLLPKSRWGRPVRFDFKTKISLRSLVSKALDQLTPEGNPLSWQEDGVTSQDVETAYKKVKNQVKTIVWTAPIRIENIPEQGPVLFFEQSQSGKRNPLNKLIKKVAAQLLNWQSNQTAPEKG